MNTLQEKTKKKIQSLFENSKIAEIDTEEPHYCGNCTGCCGKDAYSYSTIAGEYTFERCVCEDMLFFQDEKVIFGNLRISELKKLIENVKNAISEAEKKQAKEEAELEAELEK